MTNSITEAHVPTRDVQNSFEMGRDTASTCYLVGVMLMFNLGDTHEPSPKEYEEPTFKLPVTEEGKVIKDDDEQESAPTDKETYSSYITKEHWVQIRTAAKEVQPDDHEYLEKESRQPIEELIENAETDTNNELHEVNKLENEEECTEQAVKQIVYDTELSTVAHVELPRPDKGTIRIKSR